MSNAQTLLPIQSISKNGRVYLALTDRKTKVILRYAKTFSDQIAVNQLTLSVISTPPSRVYVIHVAVKEYITLCSGVFNLFRIIF